MELIPDIFMNIPEISLLITLAEEYIGDFQNLAQAVKANSVLGTADNAMLERIENIVGAIKYESQNAEDRRKKLGIMLSFLPCLSIEKLGRILKYIYGEQTTVTVTGQSVNITLPITRDTQQVDFNSWLKRLVPCDMTVSITRAFNSFAEFSGYEIGELGEMTFNELKYLSEGGTS